MTHRCLLDKVCWGRSVSAHKTFHYCNHLLAFTPHTQPRRELYQKERGGRATGCGSVICFAESLLAHDAQSPPKACERLSPAHLDANLWHIMWICEFRGNEEPELVAVRYICVAQSQQHLPASLEHLGQMTRRPIVHATVNRDPHAAFSSQGIQGWALYCTVTLAPPNMSSTFHST